MSTVAPDQQSTSDECVEQSLASLWEHAVGSPIDDRLLEWPPDVFALTDLVLERSEAYRLLQSPAVGSQWPPGGVARWPVAVEQAGREWSAWVEDGRRLLPELLTREWEVFCARAETSLDCLGDGRDWRLCEALVTLHAIADEACAGLGLALDRSDPDGCVYRARGRELLARTGSLARIPSHALRVLPKARTSLTGTLRSMSRYACMLGPRVDVRWRKLPARRRGTGPEHEAVNFLLLPWPLRVRESDFRPLEGSVRVLHGERHGLFEFAPSEKLDLDLVDGVLCAARDEVDSVDVVCLPESSVDEAEVQGLEALLDDHGVAFLQAGVRGSSDGPGRPAQNWVHTGVSPKLEKGGRDPKSTGEQWFHLRQHKHSRWLLDEAQIYQYHLGGALHPRIRWWEAIDVPRRVVEFVELGEGITLSCLVCEDLAQSDGMADILRSVAPTVVHAYLLDGPQLGSRWAARYASVLADDPGSAVLTLTSLGMAERSRPNGHDPSRVIGLWKDPGRGARDIALEPGAHAVLLSAAFDRANRVTMDGRAPTDNETDFFDVGLHQIRADGRHWRTRPSGTRAPISVDLDVDDLTILTGWAEALAEMLAVAPERAEEVIAEGCAPAWRTAFGIAEPSPTLTHAIERLARAVRSPTDDGRFDAALTASRVDASGETPLDRLVRHVLQSALEQRRTRQASESPLA